MVVRGIDVSSWQEGWNSAIGKALYPANYGTVEASGEGFVWIKATEGGGYVSPTFALQSRGVLGTSMLAGAYHFAREGLSAPNASADTFLQTIKPYPFTLPPLLDLEANKGVEGITGDALVAWAVTWLEHVEAATGKRPWIYGGAYYLDGLGPSVAALVKYPWVVAAYPWDKTHPAPGEKLAFPPPLRLNRAPPSKYMPPAVAWQWTGMGGVVGIHTPCDRIVMDGTIFEALRGAKTP